MRGVPRAGSFRLLVHIVAALACGSETYRVSLALRANCMALCARGAVGPRSDHVVVRTHCLAWQAQRFRQVESHISWHAQHVVQSVFRGRRATFAGSGTDFVAGATFPRPSAAVLPGAHLLPGQAQIS